jgi:carboxylesterase type B
MTARVLLCAVLAAAVVASADDAQPIVNVQGLGKVRGNSWAAEEFIGIPYAPAPVGNLRFAPSSIWSKSWPNVRNTTLGPPACHQAGGDTEWYAGHKVVPSSEDWYAGHKEF